MAGFAISGLFWVASNRQNSQLDPGVKVLWAAIVPLGIAPLLYGEIAGELNCNVVAAVSPLPSLRLSIGVLGIFYALAELLLSGNRDDDAPSYDPEPMTPSGHQLNLVQDRQFAYGSVLVVGTLATIGVMTGNLSLLRTFSTDDTLAIVWRTLTRHRDLIAVTDDSSANVSNASSVTSNRHFFRVMRLAASVSKTKLT
jgi:hypothetical protein